MGVWKIPHLSMIFPLRPSFIEDFPAMFDNTGGDANRRPQDYRRTDLQAGKAQRQAFQRGGRKWRGLLQHGPILKKTQLFDCDWKWHSPNLWQFRWWHIYDQWSKSAVLYFQTHPKAPIAVWYWDVCVMSEYHVVFCMQPFSNEVEKKVAAGSFGGDSPLDR